MRVLVVEDDAILAEAIRVGLSLEGFTPDTVTSATDAHAAVAATDYDAVVLDIGLPDGSGLEVLREWRRAGAVVPVLLLTARNSTKDRIDGLDCGADDYLGKPFDLEELAARVRAIGRRSKGQTSSNLSWGPFVLDRAGRELLRDGKPVALSRRELAVLEALLEQPGRIFSRSQLEDRLYGWGDEVGSNAVEVHIHRLRSKLGADVIETARGQGYRVPRR